MSVSVELFGPVTVVRDGRPVPLPGMLPRAIVARLALDAGRTVPAEDLIADVWDEPGDHTVASLRAYLSRLRGAGLEGVLRGDRSGYLLDVAEEDVDIPSFTARVGELRALPLGSPRAAALSARLLQDSSDVPLAGIDAPFATGVRSLLAEERRGVLERHADELLAAGRPEEALAALERHGGAHPRDEVVAHLTALALARSGRVAEALDALDGFGGPIPSRLRELRSGILRRDPATLGRAPRPPARTGVPNPLTRFVGRQDELDAVAAARRRHRLITLVGPGGVGKTRLAIEAARASGQDDEQWFVDLASVSDPDRVLPAIADTVGAAAHTLDALAPRLADRPTLIVLDNAEHVVGAAAAAASGILRRSDLVTVLVTSREPLRLPGELVVPVAPLLREDALAVFSERAADARGGRRGDDEELFGEICDRLDAIPLALELTAARLDVLSGAELLEAVRAGAGPDERGSGEARHDSVENAVRWSIDLLTPAQLSLLLQLSRFAGGFPEEAVLGICECDDDDPAAVLARLADKSLVAVTRGDEGDRRYRLLDTVKQVAAALDEPDPAWLERHRLWLADRAAHLGPLTRTGRAPAANAELDLLRPDLRVALDNSIAAGDRTAAVRTAGSQAHHWFTRGLLVDGIRSIDRALAVPGELPPMIEAHTLIGLMVLTYQTGDAVRTFQLLDRAYELAVAAGDTTVPAVALARTGYARSLFGDPETARRCMAEAKAYAESAEDWAKAEFLMCQGQMLRAFGESAEALESLNASYDLSIRLGYTWMAASASYVAAKVLTDERKGRDAIAELRRSIGLAASAADGASMLAGFHQLAGAFALLERHREAARIFGAVDRLGVRYGYNPVVAEGEEARKHRDRVAQALPAEDFDLEYRRGSRLGFEDLFALLDAPRPVPA
ncbi:BTAD domain-containing putative transcriptional regulator [Naasia sp. SYSU D00948]|uniref:BTAD domain-containing putative transcriptional regulator n=1 Tax=Naasia sp. SYSU D00948 TaxID=2817379 RepID=UPI001B3145B5|nr:BTAD domain-containing putative transcriptional regulator [Naasia sp. SYSU D00948]